MYHLCHSPALSSYLEVANRAAVRLPLGHIRLGIKHTELVES